MPLRREAGEIRRSLVRLFAYLPTQKEVIERVATHLHSNMHCHHEMEGDEGARTITPGAGNKDAAPFIGWRLMHHRSVWRVGPGGVNENGILTGVPCTLLASQRDARWQL
jgi:hypothetical protein